MSDDALLQPYTHITSALGKGVRSRVLDAVNALFHVNEEKMALVKKIVEQLHNSSLLIDDIEDGSSVRRGIPAAHCIFGVAHTINCANLVYFLALDNVAQLGKTAAIDAFRTEMICLHRGQGQEIYWRDNFICPTEDDYKGMVVNKTGGLFRLAVKLLQSCSENQVDFVNLVDNFSIYYQIRDDLLNLTCLDYAKSKVPFEDISEGKYSFPIIHSIRAALPDDRLDKILRKRTRDESLLRYAVKLMNQTGSLKYTREVLKEYYEKILTNIKDLGGNESLLQIINYLHQHIPPPVDEK